MTLPHTYTTINETGCCAKPDLAGWDHGRVRLEDSHFLRRCTRSFLHMPLNMGPVMADLQATAERGHATMPERDVLFLSRDLSPWRAEQLYAVTRPVDGAENVSMDGEYLTLVHEGPYRDARQWQERMERYAEEQHERLQATYFFYTTCPKCARHYGRNSVISFGRVA